MGLTDTAAWCHGRRWETINGRIRAELRLVPAAEGGRGTPIPGKGVLRPSGTSADARPRATLNYTSRASGVEYAPELAAGTSGWVRPAPLTPANWRDLRPGQTISMHEQRPV